MMTAVRFEFCVEDDASGVLLLTLATATELNLLSPHFHHIVRVLLNV